MIPAALLASILAVLALLHVYWAFGRRTSTAVVPSKDGEPLLEPGPAACLAVALLLVTAALLVLSRARIVELFPPMIAELGTWGVALAFTARAIGDFRYVGFFKRVRDTPFGRLDTRFYSPLCLLLAGLAFWLLAS